MSALLSPRLEVNMVRLSEALHGPRRGERRVVEVNPVIAGYYLGRYVVSIADLPAIRHFNALVDKRNDQLGIVPDEEHIVPQDQGLAWYPTRAGKLLEQVGAVEAYARAYNLVSAPNAVHDQKCELARPWFSGKEIEPRLAQICRARADAWVGDLEAGDLEIFGPLLRVALRMSVEAFVGVPLGDAEARDIVHAFKTYVPWFLRTSWLTLLGLNAEHLPLMPHRGALESLRAAAEGLVERRRRLGAARTDYIGALLVEQAAGRIPLRDVVDEVMVVLFAGHDTTASWVSSAVAMAAAHPSAQAQLRADLRAARAGGLALGPAADRYATRFLLEVGRLYPPVPMTARRTMLPEHVEVAGRTYFFPAGTAVFLDVYSAHRQEETYGPDPLAFDPNRPSLRQQPPSIFSDPGQRTCIGSKFAYHQAQAILTALLARYDVSLAKPGLELTSPGVMQLRNDPDGLLVRLTRR